MKKKLLVLTMVCLGFAGVQAQDNKQAQESTKQVQAVQDTRLAQLMNEREQLVMEYQFYNQQNSNFWGKKSKSDLINIIETLKKIINTDSELIGVIKAASIKKVAESTVETQREGKITVEDQRLIKARMSDLQSQINTLQSQIKKRERSIKDLQDQLKATDEVRYGKDRVIAILAVAAFILLLYAVFLQVRLGNAGKKKRKKAA
ncbi:hypothetical protein [Pontibacter ruber]|uniref:Uncharacterized protein n=1 Tax=Pontibacter ruber TaxID=1343895 RepID=A0ABW5CTF1_9BACT|nr:hypothetical protein [Pontibacter ruber]